MVFRLEVLGNLDLWDVNYHLYHLRMDLMIGSPLRGQRLNRLIALLLFMHHLVACEVVDSPFLVICVH